MQKAPKVVGILQAKAVGAHVHVPELAPIRSFVGTEMSSEAGVGGGRAPSCRVGAAAIEEPASLNDTAGEPAPLKTVAEQPAPPRPAAERDKLVQVPQDEHDHAPLVQSVLMDIEADAEAKCIGSPTAWANDAVAEETPSPKTATEVADEEPASPKAAAEGPASPKAAAEEQPSPKAAAGKPAYVKPLETERTVTALGRDSGDGGDGDAAGGDGDPHGWWGGWADGHGGWSHWWHGWKGGAEGWASSGWGGLAGKGSPTPSLIRPPLTRFPHSLSLFRSVSLVSCSRTSSVNLS